ncbi:winged helix-turn-helix domain-containing protein [Nocardiopsis metallicus]|uniref:FHA domain-containing protein n=1 Tax=Nocardiopsis metallicus TaxID=179819 RepID=A0A840WK13_9ACTN|nr:winged helix-turn-helix domain-containing protein [Nocardiopsis metallicus]MBB5492017.1 hypothetical protein [Nocardiopsis metallicus]
MSVHPLLIDEADEVVTVQQDYESDTPMDTHHLAPGQTRTFGRGGRNRDVDMRLAAGDRAVHRHAGDIISHGDHWRISNLSPNKSYIVENTERLAGFVQVPPNTHGMLVPFETSRVRIPGAEGEHSFLVMAPAACSAILVPGPGGDLQDTDDWEDSTGERTEANSFRMDRWHTYYRVLVAYCEPRLRGLTPPVPTQRQVAERLNIGPAAVNAHVDYLLKDKFKVELEGGGHGQGWRAQALIEKALYFGVVTERDLVILDQENDTPKGLG